MAFNKNLAVKNIRNRIERLEQKKIAWAEEALRLWDAGAAALLMGRGGEDGLLVFDACWEAREEAVAEIRILRGRIERLESKVRRIQSRR